MSENRDFKKLAEQTNMLIAKKLEEYDSDGGLLAKKIIEITSKHAESSDKQMASMFKNCVRDMLKIKEG